MYVLGLPIWKDMDLYSNTNYFAKCSENITFTVIDRVILCTWIWYFLYCISRDENRRSDKKKEEHPYPFQNLIRFATFSQNPENFVLVIFGTKRGNLLKRGTFSFLMSVNDNGM